jgi:hypothetical protein
MKQTVSISPVGVGALDDPRMLRSPPYIRLLSFLIVGATIGRPRSLRSQIEPPSVIFFDCRDRRPRLSELATVTNCTFVCCRNKNSHLTGRGRRPRRPEVVSVTAAHPSVILPDCRDRRPRRSELVTVTKCTLVRCRNKNPHHTGRGRRPRRPKVVSVTNGISVRCRKRGLH